MLGDTNRIAPPAPGRDDAPASLCGLILVGQETGGRSGCASSPSSEQSSQGIAPGCGPGEEAFLPTHVLPTADTRGLGGSAHSSNRCSMPSSGAGTGPPPLYCAGMVSYPQSGAGGRDGVQHPTSRPQILACPHPLQEVRWGWRITRLHTIRAMTTLR